MTNNEIKRISRLLTSAACNRAMSDDCSKEGDHSGALHYQRKESADWVALYKEFGISNGAQEVHKKVAGVAA